MGVMSLFGEIEDAGPMFDERPAIPDVEFAKRERLSFEKEMLGLYVSDHPLMGAEASLRRKCDGTLTDLDELADEIGRALWRESVCQYVEIPGVAVHLKKK